MKYYKLGMDTERKNDIIGHLDKGKDTPQNMFIVGKKLELEEAEYCFFYDRMEGNVITDYLANDKGWFLVSTKLKVLLETVNTEIQFFPVKVVEKQSGEELLGYYIANITRVVDALCLEKSTYFTTELEDLGPIHTVIKYGILAEKTEDSDVFKLANQQQVPIFVSERFARLITEHAITGIRLQMINVK